MTVIASYLYRLGERVREVPLASARVASNDDEFVWIGLEDATKEDLETLQDLFDLHPLAVKDAASAHQLPKLAIYGEQLFVVARPATLVADTIEYGETAVFVGKHHIVSVRHGSARGHADLRRQLEAAPRLLAQGVPYVLHGILTFIVDGYVPIVETIEEEVLSIEQRAATAFLTRDEINHLFTLQRELIRFQRVLGPMSELCSKIVRLQLPAIDEHCRPYFSDVFEHIQRVIARVEALREILKSVFEISTLLEQQRQGQTTRQLAAWAAILAVPTALAGIYGMNFEFMPELRSPWGYPTVLVVILLICSVLYMRFKRLCWL
jgi:magnesium transporter